jgi:parvulin-like peptidyl-prolyl isomerase
MKRIILFTGGFLAISAVLAFGQIDLQPVAIVRLSKTEQITVKQLKEYVGYLSITKAMTTGTAELTETEKRQALDELGNQFLACQAAEQEKLTVTDREISQYFDQGIKSFSEGLAQLLAHTPTDAEIDTELRNRTGMSRASFRDFLRRNLIANNYLRQKKRTLLEAVKAPTDAEVQTLYNEIKGRNIFDGGVVRPDTARVRMLLVPIRNAGERGAALTTANSLKNQIGSDPGMFDEKVQEVRTGSSYLKGEGYVYNHDQFRQAMGNDFVDAVFKLKQGEVSRLLERSDGFYIVKVIETYRTKTLGLNDIYNLEDPRGITVKQMIFSTESQRRSLAALQQAKVELDAELRKRGSVEIKNDIYQKIAW